MKISTLLLIPLLIAPLVAADKQNAPVTRLEKEVRHELVMLPRLNVFDDLSFRVDGNNVTLMGAVTNPVLKSDAEKAVKSIEGVGQVNNRIEVLPLSPNDDQIRRATYMALVREPQLQVYFMQALPSIRILVKDGHVTLDGVVDRQADSDLANITANGVPGVFGVVNKLRIGD